MKLFVKIKDKITAMQTENMKELPKYDLLGNMWVKIKGEWHPARKEGEEMDLEHIKYVGDGK